MDSYSNIGHNVTKLLRVPDAERCVGKRIDTIDSQYTYSVVTQ